MQLVYSLSFVKLLRPFVRIISYTHDQDHVHISTTCYASTLEESKNSIHPQNKTPCSCMTPLSLKKYAKDMGLCKKKIKDAYPKKVCHMLRHVKKKENKRCIPKEGMPHAQACQKKIQPLIQKERKRERWCIQRSSYTIHQKYPHICTS